MDAHRKRHLNQDYLTPGNKREGAYGCCLDLIASQNTSEIAKLQARSLALKKKKRRARARRKKGRKGNIRETHIGASTG